MKNPPRQLLPEGGRKQDRLEIASQRSEVQTAQTKAIDASSKPIEAARQVFWLPDHPQPLLLRLGPNGTEVLSPVTAAGTAAELHGLPYSPQEQPVMNGSPTN